MENENVSCLFCRGFFSLKREDSHRCRKAAVSPNPLLWDGNLSLQGEEVVTKTKLEVEKFVTGLWRLEETRDAKLTVSELPIAGWSIKLSQMYTTPEMSARV